MLTLAVFFLDYLSYLPTKQVEEVYTGFTLSIPLSICPGLGGAVRFLVVGTIGKEERPPRGQLWMEQCLTSLKYWPI